MSYVVTRRRSPVFKPSGRLMLDNSHSLATNLAFAVVPEVNGPAHPSTVVALSGQNARYPRDLVSGKMPTQTVGARSDFGYTKELSSYPHDKQLETVYRTSAISANPGVLNYGRTQASDITSKGSIFAICRQYQNAFSRATLISDGENSNGYGFQLYVDDVAVVTNGFWLHGNNSDQGSPTSDILGASHELRYHRLAMTWDGTNIKSYTGGKLVDTDASAFAATAHANRVTKLFADRADLKGFTGGLSIILVWARAISEPEYQALYQNPWQILKPRPTIVLMPSATVGAPASTSSNLLILGCG